MKYRQFGKLNWKVSALGYGIMRMPVLDRETGAIDEEESIKMIRKGIDLGINYIDTAYPYHGGKSENLVASALRGGYRDKVKVATKLPSWLIETKSDLDKYFNEQLERLESDSVDFYLLHALNEKNWQKLKDVDIFSWLEEKKRQGQIQYGGFSFHDELPLFKEIIDSYDKWDFCQVQYNFMDRNYQAGEEGVIYAAERGLGIIVMEPLKGGQLAYKYPDSVQKIWDKSDHFAGPVERALAWLWDQEYVSVVLSGMSAMEHVIDNTEIADRFEINSLSPKEKELYDQAADAYRALSPVPCTTCRYCMPCPFGVDIPGNFDLYNDAVMYSSYEQCREIYNEWF
ncbi:MAG: aldo/keto reductase, partial [Spirochaetaceae bacterium]|nr:aldo/keto reductase [Spirochaetaceae bacterium]